MSFAFENFYGPTSHDKPLVHVVSKVLTHVSPFAQKMCYTQIML